MGGNIPVHVLFQERNMFDQGGYDYELIIAIRDKTRWNCKTCKKLFHAGELGLPGPLYREFKVGLTASGTGIMRPMWFT